MDRNLRLAVERVNAWHLARVLARTASEADADTTAADAPIEAQSATSIITDAAVSLDSEAVEEPTSTEVDGRRRMH